MRYHGRLTSWNDGKGYGFVTPSGGGDKVFVHIKPTQMWPFQVSINVREGVGAALVVVALVLTPVAWAWSRRLWLVVGALSLVGLLLFFSGRIARRERELEKEAPSGGGHGPAVPLGHSQLHGLEARDLVSSRVLTWCAILATAVQGTILVGLGYFVRGVIETFREITASGESDPTVMAQGLGEAMVPVVVAVGFSAFGILGSVLIILASNYRARWFYRSSVTLGVVHLLAVPFGTAFGLAFLVLLLVKRREFRRA